jgi:2-oxoisovalerate dehydrogenase E1 component
VRELRETATQPQPGLLQAYWEMLFIRRFEERCLALSADVIAGSVHLCAGQESVPVAARRALSDQDKVVTTYRGHGWALAWGVPPAQLLAEICHRESGVNGGRAGSALVMAPEVGFVGENSIVGAGLPIAAGVALAAKLRSTGAITLVSFGDGAMNQGAAHEAFAFAAAVELPIIFVCENNGWSEMTPISRTIGSATLAQRASAYSFPVLSVDATDYRLACEAFEEAATLVRTDGGPVYLECETVRLLGHYNRDVEHYRAREEREADRSRDPLTGLRADLQAEGLAGAAELEAGDAEIVAELDDLVESVTGLPFPDPLVATDHVRSTEPVLGLAGQATADEEMTFGGAVNLALHDELASRAEVLVYGEDVGYSGGIFGVTRRLQRDFGESRVFDTPISEAAILGSAVGAALEGLRPIVEIMWIDFMLVALDQLVNQAANIRYVTEGRHACPLVVRTQQGATPGSCPQHSQSLEAILAHIPGLKVGIPATPQDAYTMLRAAVADPDPCIIIEARRLYLDKGPVDPSRREAIGQAAFRREGTDLALVTWGTALGPSLAAAEALAAGGIEASVLDLRWLSPVDDAALAEAVRRGKGRVLVVHEANRTGGFGAEVAARITEAHFDELEMPVFRLGTPDTRIPASPALQDAVLPTASRIEAEARRLLDAPTRSGRHDGVARIEQGISA